jgi:hypothetical protein
MSHCTSSKTIIKKKENECANVKNLYVYNCFLLLLNSLLYQYEVASLSLVI